MYCTVLHCTVLHVTVLCPPGPGSIPSLQVLTMGGAFSLEQRLQLGEAAGGQEKLEITLLNLVLPLLLLAGSGRKVDSRYTHVYIYQNADTVALDTYCLPSTALCRVDIRYM